MSNKQMLSGFSKISSLEKLQLISTFYKDGENMEKEMLSFHHADEDTQKLLSEFSENTITNFPMPFSIAPNFKIDGELYHVPMVIEESSVVAAASKSAKFWADKGGFKTEIIGMEKIGHVHFDWKGDTATLVQHFPELKKALIEGTMDITENMRKRGGGILDIELKDLTDKEPGLMQLHCTFDTQDSMGANFVNSCLEEFAEIFKAWFAEAPYFNESYELDIIMCILSNFTPNCRVKIWVECPVSDFDGEVPGVSGAAFAEKFAKAVRIAEIDPYRATTHNKGIYNGIDSVVLATGNDFRAIEACGHAYASHTGQYKSLTHVDIVDGQFKFTLDVPMAIGVVGGLTNLHPVVKRALELLGHPSAAELMKIAAAAGLANNFGAVKSLTTTGIQQGHMKMHLMNILNTLGANEAQKKTLVAYFQERKVTVADVRKAYEELQAKEEAVNI